MKSLKARPTEYKGVLYASKCEAMYARYLEIWSQSDYQRMGAGSQKHKGQSGPWFGCGFTYQPAELVVGDYPPDFFYWEARATMSCVPRLSGVVIEYKPSRPTKTYVNQWADHCEQMIDTLITLGCHSITFELPYGSVFNHERGAFYYDFIKKSVRHLDTDWLDPFEADIRATRFDLEAQ